MHEHDPVTYDILGAAMKVHNNWGPGFLEAVYQKSLDIELRRRGHIVAKEVPFDLFYEGVPLGLSYRADLVCDDVLIELKAHSGLGDADYAQVLHYLRCTGLRRGLLLNFGTPKLQKRRFVHGWPDSAPSASSVAAPVPDGTTTSQP